MSIGTFLREEDAEQSQKDDQEHMDPVIEEKVYLVKEDWKLQGQLIDNLQEELVSMRTEVAKTTALPMEVRIVGNDVSGLVENVNTLGTDFIELQANMLGVTQDIQATKADMSSLKKSCHAIKGDTSMIKSSPDTMKSCYLALSIEHQTVLGQIKSSRQDIQEFI